MPRSMLGKSLAILLQMAVSGGIRGVHDLAKSAGLSPATVHRLLQTLVKEGFATWDDATKAYGIGPETIRFAVVVQSHSPIERIARPVMRRLAAAVGETVTLNVYVPSEQVAVCAAVEESKKPLHYVLPIGERKLLHAGASCKSILAFLPPERRAEILRQRSLAPVTERTMTNPTRLEKELADCRARGYAMSRGERLTGAVGIGAPVFGADGGVVASMVITIPEHRFKPASETRLAKALREHVAELSSMLGFVAPTEIGIRA